VDGGIVDPNNPVETNLHDPVFSPDGGTIAYALHGVNLFDLATSVSSLILQDVNYRPQAFSPDGTKILMTVNVPFSDATHDVVYVPATSSTVGFTSVDGSFFCCGRETWSQDGLSLYAANPTMGMLTSGLWRVDTTSGSITTLLPADAGNGKFNLAAEPYLASDGQLYYFYLNGTDAEGFSGMAPLQMVRSAPDGVTGRTVLRPETFEALAEALWAPDGSFVIAAKRSDTDGGLELYYTDAAKGMISLLASGGAQQLKWGP
jgi:Tol biopolymer transport system component